MHACGHDGHMSMLLVAAEVIVSMKHRLQGSVKLLFQPGEEGHRGAKLMIDGNCLQNPKVDQVYGIHLWSYLKVGVVGVKSGPLMAASEGFYIDVKGRGGHGAAPQGTCDAIIAGTNLVSQLNTIVSRNIAPLDSAVVTVGTFNSGYNANVISDLTKISGTIRSFEEPVMEILHQRMKEICVGIEKSFNVEVDLKFAVDRSYPVTRNSSRECVENVRRAALKVVPSELVTEPQSTMGAEDFSFFLNELPGCFFFIGSYPGTADPKKEAAFEYLDRPHHKFNFDLHEDALGVGASIWVQLIEDLLAKSGSQPPSPKRLKK
eukprot:TRINITY_DN6631_c0_g1_i5.p1 TRINITY_DN6631_c0_g1~~TRINITY_DN6631_c0_g1_i5.p1  ORF type:complete len:319 (+),score=91.45 TRINITY_DN6631_c0_g1_i5:1489-2445(+)